MQLSRYIKIYPYKEDPGCLLLYSTKRASSVLVPESILTSIENSTLDPSDADTLSSLGFLVPDLNEERKEMSELIDELNRQRHFNAIVVLNLDCNLSCRYCFEGNMKGRHYMSLKTADRLIEFTQQYLNRGKNINIDFYGGEPLLSFDTLEYISERLRISAEKKHLKYTFGLITNGTLLTKERAARLSSYGLNDVQITLDGLKDNHDIYRPFKSGSGSFDIIIRNIAGICEIINVHICGNYNAENYKNFPRLLDYLCINNIAPDKLSSVRFNPITKVSDKFAIPDFRDGSDSINEQWIMEAGKYIREEVLKRGFHTPKIMPSPCAIELKDDIILYYDGTFYKCPAFIGREGLAIGSLESGIEDYRESHNLDLWKTEECLDCEYLPICFGGCRFLKLIRDGNLNGIDCKKPYLDATLETFIKQDLLYRPKT